MGIQFLAKSRVYAMILVAATLALSACQQDPSRMELGVASGASLADAPPIPSPISSATGGVTLSNLQNGSWQTCGACGNSGGGGNQATYQVTTNISDPSLSGASALFSIGGPYAYSDAYWWIPHPNPSSLIQRIVYDFFLGIPSAYVNTPQAIEFECQQTIGGRVYNFAWQADYASHYWRTFNYATKNWESSGIPFNGLQGGVWHRITAEYHATYGYAYHDALTVDGNRIPLSISHAAPSASGGQFSNAFQLDLDKNADPFQVYVDRMQVIYQP